MNKDLNESEIHENTLKLKMMPPEEKTVLLE